MAKTWTAADLPVLADPNVIDAVGQFMHAHQAEGYRFEMPVMGYQVLLYDRAFADQVKTETGIADLKDLVHEVRRGSFVKPDPDGWELSFRAEALIRNEIDPSTRAPVGEVDYASDLEYENTVLYSVHDNGLEAFVTWAKANGVLG